MQLPVCLVAWPRRSRYWLGLTSTAIRTALGTRSCSSPSRLAAISATKKLMPVALPPGRARLATRPSLTGSSPTPKTIGIVVVAALAASAAGVAAGRGDNGHVAADEIGHERRQAIVLALQPVVLHRHVLALDVAGFVEAFTERSRAMRAEASGDWPLTRPTTGIAGCCACAASGHAAAAPPRRLMNSRRRISAPKLRGQHCIGSNEYFDRAQIEHQNHCRGARQCR